MTAIVRLDPKKMHKKAAALYKFLRQHLVGQDRAIERVVASYGLSLTPLRPLDKPVFSGLFLGPSGSGKTYLAELLAQFILGDRYGFIKIAGAEYSQSHEIARLFGSPPGYANYYNPDDPNSKPPILSQENINHAGVLKVIDDYNHSDKYVKELSQKMLEIRNQVSQIEDRESPTLKLLSEQYQRLESVRSMRLTMLTEGRPIPSVILFDEIEKANGVIHNALLEVTSKASATMSNGDKTDFSGSFIIMTSNVGSRGIADVVSGRSHIGFVSGKNSNSIYSVAMKELRSLISPELIGRIKENIVVFRPLTNEQMMSIIDFQIKLVTTRLMRQLGMAIILSEDVREFIFERSCDHLEYGARPIEDKIRHHITEPLASFIGSGQMSEGDCITIEVIGNELVFLKEERGRKKISTPNSNFIQALESSPKHSGQKAQTASES